jgi:hypothetical protein
MLIYEEDWSEFCRNLKPALMLLIEEPEFGIHFPINPQFYWCVKQLGQNWEYNRITPIQNLVKLSGNYTLAIHCAYDQQVENHISWWKPQTVNQSWTTPTENRKTYRVGMIPGLGNTTFQLPEDHSCSHVQYYTKFASQSHKDHHQFFITPYIANTLAEKYSNHLHGIKPQNETAKYRLLKRSVPLNYMRRLTTAAESSCAARVEFVYYSSNEENIDQGIRRAFEYTNNLYQDHFNSNMIHAMPTEKFASRLRRWTPIFTNTLTNLKGKYFMINTIIVVRLLI